MKLLQNSGMPRGELVCVVNYNDNLGRFGELTFTNISYWKKMNGTSNFFNTLL